MFNSPPAKSPTPSPMQGQPSPNPTMMTISDTRKVDSVTGKPVGDSGSLTRSADPALLRQIIQESKRQKVDPYTALAMAHQESGFSEDNPFHLLGGGKTDDPVKEGVAFLKDKLDYARRLGKTDEASQIQAFNGYGKVGSHTEGNQKMMYGIDVSKAPIDMNKTPVYGKRVLDIRENILKKNPEIAKLVAETQ
jgi:hypothetical protein